MRYSQANQLKLLHNPYPNKLTLHPNKVENLNHLLNISHMFNCVTVVPAHLKCRFSTKSNFTDTITINASKITVTVTANNIYSDRHFLCRQTIDSKHVLSINNLNCYCDNWHVYLYGLYSPCIHSKYSCLKNSIYKQNIFYQSLNTRYAWWYYVARYDPSTTNRNHLIYDNLENSQLIRS